MTHAELVPKFRDKVLSQEGSERFSIPKLAALLVTLCWSTENFYSQDWINLKNKTWVFSVKLKVVVKAFE